MVVILKRFGNTQFSAILSLFAQLRKRAEYLLKRGVRVEVKLLESLGSAPGGFIFCKGFSVKTFQ